MIHSSFQKNILHMIQIKNKHDFIAWNHEREGNQKTAKL